MPSWSRFFKIRKIWSFHVVVWQRMAKKCTKIYNAHAQLLFCSLNLLFGDVPVATAVVVCLLSSLLKALAKEDTLLRTHCCRHKCFPVCPRTQHLLRTQKVFLILFRNILCPQQMFPSLRSPRNITGNNVSSFTRALIGSFSMTTATAGLTPCKKMNSYSTFEFRKSVNLFGTPIGLKICSGQTCTDSDHFQKKIPKLAVVVRVLQNT